MTVRVTVLAPDSLAGLMGTLEDDTVARIVTFKADDKGPEFAIPYAGVETQVIERLMEPRLAADQGYFRVYGALEWFTRPGDVWYHTAGPKPALELGFRIAGRELLANERQRPRTFASHRGLGDVVPNFSEPG
jgi:hypothetical protein